MHAQLALLGLCLTDPNNSLETCIAQGISEDHFDDPKCKSFWQALLELKAGDKPIEPATLETATNDPMFIATVLDKSPITQNIEPYIAEVKAHIWRQKSAPTLSSSARLVGESKPFSDIVPLIDEVERSLSVVLNGPTGDIRKSESALDLAQSVAGEIDDRVSDFVAGKLRGIPTGFKTLDRCFGGWFPGNLYLLGARTSVGKTTLAVNFAHNAATLGRNIVYFTIEMSGDELAEKMLSRISMVDGSRIRTGNLKPDHMDAIAEALGRMAKMPFIVCDKASRTIEGVEAQTRSLWRKGLADMIIVDYVQLMRCQQKFDSRQAEVAEISWRLKSLAKSLDIPILALVQVNRDADKAKDSRPQLSQLRDSGALEQDADSVLLLHRSKDDYAIEAGCWSYMLNIAKNRHGMTGEFPIASNLPVNFFGNPNGEF